MWLNNNAKEVECFHPVCKKAFEEALKSTNLFSTYEVQHHRYVGNIEMDLVVSNRKTNKILCVIEVKRTIAAVNSTRYQYQAMSYVQSLREVELESKYYILTNLESSCLFKFDQNRPNVYEQIIEPGLLVNHRFSEVDKETFMSDLVKQYSTLLSVIVNDEGEYLLSFKSFAHEIQDKLDTDLEWKKNLVGLFYEYIRGSFSKINRNGLRTIAQLSNKIDLICHEALKINFSDIFTLPELSSNETKILSSKTLLKQLFELGKTYVDADEIANVMHKVVSEKHKHEGEVPTDIELANMMLWIVKCIRGELVAGEKIMDPAAGSGNLLCAAVNAFSNIEPSQLIANDINPKLLQLLSLRIGLKFAKTVEKDNTAQILSLDIADIPVSVFDNVKIVLLNPPYLSAVGVNCAERKAKLYERIRLLKGCEPTTINGQMPLEGPFVELVSTLVKEGTIMAVILPNALFTTKGEASKAIRMMLLNDFGLQMIFNYPQENLFEGVAQNTSVVIGIKGGNRGNVRYIYCNEIISELDENDIRETISANLNKSQLQNINNHFEGIILSRDELGGSVDCGWQIGNMSRQDAQNFIKANFSSSLYLTPLSESEFSNYQRGKIGNSGCTDLLFLRQNNPFLKENKKLLNKHLAIGLNNAKLSTMDIKDGESVFFNVAGMSDSQIKKIVSYFIEYKDNKIKKQRRDNKSVVEYIDVLKKESLNISPAYSVMLPRMIRSGGRVYLSNKPVYVSTNFFVIQADEERAKILASWFSTIFYQLECEAYGNNRKGLRKLEKEDYEPLHVPITSQLTNEQKNLILTTPITEFVNLRSPQVRDIDLIWANILFGEDAEQLTEEVLSLVPILVADREK